MFGNLDSKANRKEIRNGGKLLKFQMFRGITTMSEMKQRCGGAHVPGGG